MTTEHASQVEALRARVEARVTKHSVIAVTSAARGDGKSVTAALLAESLSKAGYRCVLVDASAGDAQRESSRSAPAGSSGFVEVPLASGEGAALSRDIVHATLRQLRLEFDFVIVDADPISNNGITLLICTVADGVIITVRAERPKRAVDHQLAKLLGVADATVLGVTLVGAEMIAEHRERRHAVLWHGEPAAPGGLRPQDVSDVVGA